MKLCSKCNKEQPLSSFNRKGSNYQYSCKSCQSAYLKEHYSKNKQKYAASARKSDKTLRTEIATLKASTPCSDCGIKYPHYVMDFDHVVGTTKVGDVSRLKKVSRKLALDEIAKCDIVCSNCHRERTYKRQLPP